VLAKLVVYAAAIARLVPAVSISVHVKAAPVLYSPIAVAAAV